MNDAIQEAWSLLAECATRLECEITGKTHRCVSFYDEKCDTCKLRDRVKAALASLPEQRSKETP